MIRRVLSTLALAATVGVAVAACNSTPATSPEPSVSFGPVVSPSASDSTQSMAPSAAPSGPVASPSPAESAAPTAS